MIHAHFSTLLTNHLGEGTQDLPISVGARGKLVSMIPQG